MGVIAVRGSVLRDQPLQDGSVRLIRGAGHGIASTTERRPPTEAERRDLEQGDGGQEHERQHQRYGPHVAPADAPDDDRRSPTERSVANG